MSAKPPMPPPDNDADDQSPNIDMDMLPSSASSNVAGYGYHAPSKTTAVQFKGKDGKPGDTHHYKGVPPSVHSGLKIAKSKGSYVAQNLKGKYPSRKVSGGKK